VNGQLVLVLAVLVVTIAALLDSGPQARRAPVQVRSRRR
jgi:hypothetical protein